MTASSFSPVTVASVSVVAVAVSSLLVFFVAKFVTGKRFARTAREETVTNPSTSQRQVTLFVTSPNNAEVSHIDMGEKNGEVSVSF